MKTVKKLLIGAAVFLLLVYGINVWSGRQRQQLPAPTPETVTVTQQQPPELATIDRISDIMKQTAPDDWIISWTYDPEIRTVWFIIIDPEVTEEAIRLTKENPDSLLDRWNASVSSTIELQKEISRDLEISGFQDITVVLEQRNPDNTEEKWLVVANGIAGYDVVNGVDLLNGQS